MHCAWSQVFTDNLKTWKFDDSVTVVELNLTNDTELIHKHKSCLLMYIFAQKTSKIQTSINNLKREDNR